jgi:hypothetical protein
MLKGKLRKWYVGVVHNWHASILRSTSGVAKGFSRALDSVHRTSTAERPGPLISSIMHQRERDRTFRLSWSKALEALFAQSVHEAAPNGPEPSVSLQLAAHWMRCSKAEITERKPT